MNESSSGVTNFGSRWGIKGLSEASEGLTAVYKFETRIGDGKASQNTNQRYVGLSGGFGTIAAGVLPNATANHIGFVDNSNWYGDDGVPNKVGDTISYSVGVGSASFQIDAVSKPGDDDDLDETHFGASLNIGENAKVGLGYVNHSTMDADMPIRKENAKVEDNKVISAAVAADPMAHFDSKTTMVVAGQYSVGGVTMHLGYGETLVTAHEKQQSEVSHACQWQGKGLECRTDFSDSCQGNVAESYGLRQFLADGVNNGADQSGGLDLKA